MEEYKNTYNIFNVSSLCVSNYQVTAHHEFKVIMVRLFSCYLPDIVGKKWFNFSFIYIPKLLISIVT